MRGKRVFATGGTGFIGSHLTQRLAGLGVELGLFIHAKESPLSARRIYGDLRDSSNLFHFLRGFQPEIIFHLAAQPLVRVAMEEELRTLQTNIDGTYNLLHACKGLESLKAFVHVSTDKVYGEFDDTVSEENELHGVNHPYNASKLCGDVIAQMYAKAFDIPVIICRSGNIYGEGDENLDRLIPGAIVSALKGESLIIRSDGKMVRDYIYVDDIIDAYLLLAETISKDKNWQGKAVNFGAEEPMSVLDVVHEVLGATNRIDLVPKIMNTARLEIPYQHLDWGLARSLGWNPKIGLEEGLRKTIPWYKEYLNGKS